MHQRRAFAASLLLPNPIDAEATVQQEIQALAPVRFRAHVQPRNAGQFPGRGLNAHLQLDLLGALARHHRSQPAGDCSQHRCAPGVGRQVQRQGPCDHRNADDEKGEGQ
jgi:hypothetical protein